MRFRLWGVNIGQYNRRADMQLTTRERKALDAARHDDGIDRSEFSKVDIGAKTIGDLIERGLLETFPHPVVPDRALYRATDVGKAAAASRPIAAPKPARPRVKMLQPRIPTLDTGIAPLRRKR